MAERAEAGTGSPNVLVRIGTRVAARVADTVRPGGGDVRTEAAGRAAPTRSAIAVIATDTAVVATRRSAAGRAAHGPATGRGRHTGRHGTGMASGTAGRTDGAPRAAVLDRAGTASATAGRTDGVRLMVMLDGTGRAAVTGARRVDTHVGAVPVAGVVRGAHPSRPTVAGKGISAHGTANGEHSGVPRVTTPRKPEAAGTQSEVVEAGRKGERSAAVRGHVPISARRTAALTHDGTRPTRTVTCGAAVAAPMDARRGTPGTKATSVATSGTTAPGTPGMIAMSGGVTAHVTGAPRNAGRGTPEVIARFARATVQVVGTKQLHGAVQHPAVRGRARMIVGLGRAVMIVGLGRAVTIVGLGRVAMIVGLGRVAMTGERVVPPTAIEVGTSGRRARRTTGNASRCTRAWNHDLMSRRRRPRRTWICCRAASGRNCAG